MSVGIIIILMLSVITTTSITTPTLINSPLMVDPYPQLDVEKKVKYGSSGWVDEIQEPIGTIVRFNISVIYHDIDFNDSCRIFSKINIVDHLGNFEYKDNVSCSWPSINPDDYVKYNYSTNTYTWKFNKNLTLSETSYSNISVFYLEFDAKVNYSGSFRNYVEVNGTESCCGRYAYSDADAFVNVSEPNNPAINLTKYVKEKTSWVKNISVDIGDTVYFKLLIHNTGNVVLTNVTVIDDLPAFLSFNNDANIIPATFNNHHIVWNLGTLAVNQTIEIIFSANATTFGEADNFAIVTTNEGPTDDDTAHIIVLSQGDLRCSKKVWDPDTQQWVDQINADVGDTVRFNITFIYSGAGTCTNIKIIDTLPVYLEYANNANPAETGTNDNKLFWNLTDILTNEQIISIEFDALVIAFGANVNTVNITGTENCCAPLFCEDTATVIVEKTPPPDQGLRCEKKVWDQDTQNWVEEINADIGDTVRFKITVSYWGSLSFYYIWINDTLPICLDYNNNATPSQPIQVNGKEITWYFPVYLRYGNSISLEFDAVVISKGININEVYITGWECGIHRLYCEDTATVIVEELPSDLECEKKVWDPGTQQWVEQINVDIGDTVRFNITLTYNGNATFLDIHVKDILPVCLQYANNASLVETGKNNSVVFWNLSDILTDGQSISIEFDALAISSGMNINTVNITGYERCIYLLSCEDTATVIVAELPLPDLQCEKKVWDPDTQQWVEEINAEVGDTVRFKIVVSYWGSLAFYNIWVNDTLPTCLEYMNNATPYQPVKINGKTVSWNPIIYLKYGENITLEFDALVISDGTNINIVNITGIECGIRQLSCEDTATVLVEKQPDPLVANAGGPYNGYVSESVQLTGSATGGISPYTYTWDLDNDDIYDDGTGLNPTYTWGAKGTYIIYLKVNDTRGINDTDTAQVTIIERNVPPNTPSTPEGPESGKTKKVLNYTSSAVDPNGDMVYLQFDWDDGNTSGWLGPFTSGSSHQVSYTWAAKGTYDIKVKAKDTKGEESAWSSTFTVTIKRNFNIPYTTSILDHLKDRFPSLENLLTALLNILETMRLNHPLLV